MADNLLVVHGGGPTAVINASLYGVIREAKKNPSIGKVQGAIGGTGAIFTEQFLDLTSTHSIVAFFIQPSRASLRVAVFFLPSGSESKNSFSVLPEVSGSSAGQGGSEAAIFPACCLPGPKAPHD